MLDKDAKEVLRRRGARGRRKSRASLLWQRVATSKKTLIDQHREARQNERRAVVEALKKPSGRRSWADLEVLVEWMASNTSTTLAGLGHEALIELAGQMGYQQYRNNDVIVREGDKGDVFYVIISGTCSVAVKGDWVADLKAGTTFGEIALQTRGGRRNASIYVARDCNSVEVAEIDAEPFHQFVAAEMEREHQNTVDFLKGWKKLFGHWTDSKVDGLAYRLKLSRYPEPRKEPKAKPRTEVPEEIEESDGFDDGSSRELKPLISTDQRADSMCFLMEGRIQIQVSFPAPSGGKPILASKTLTAPDFFGELAFIKGHNVYGMKATLLKAEKKIDAAQVGRGRVRDAAKAAGAPSGSSGALTALSRKGSHSSLLSHVPDDADDFEPCVVLRLARADFKNFIIGNSRTYRVLVGSSMSRMSELFKSTVASLMPMAQNDSSASSHEDAAVAPADGFKQAALRRRSMPNAKPIEASHPTPSLNDGNRNTSRTSKRGLMFILPPEHDRPLAPVPPSIDDNDDKVGDNNFLRQRRRTLGHALTEAIAEETPTIKELGKFSSELRGSHPNRGLGRGGNLRLVVDVAPIDSGPVAAFTPSLTQGHELGVASASQLEEDIIEQPSRGAARRVLEPPMYREVTNLRRMERIKARSHRLQLTGKAALPESSEQIFLDKFGLRMPQPPVPRLPTAAIPQSPMNGTVYSRAENDPRCHRGTRQRSGPIGGRRVHRPTPLQQHRTAMAEIEASRLRRAHAPKTRDEFVFG